MGGHTQLQPHTLTHNPKPNFAPWGRWGGGIGDPRIKLTAQWLLSSHYQRCFTPSTVQCVPSIFPGHSWGVITDRTSVTCMVCVLILLGEWSQTGHPSPVWCVCSSCWVPPSMASPYNNSTDPGIPWGSPGIL